MRKDVRTGGSGYVSTLRQELIARNNSYASLNLLPHVTSYGDLSQFAQQQSRASAFILSIDDEEFTPGPELDPAVVNLRAFIEEIRFRNAEIPIYLYGETRTSRHIPNDAEHRATFTGRNRTVRTVAGASG